MRAGSILNTTGDLTSDGWNVSFGRSFTDHGYQLSYQNELVVSGCNVMVTLLADTGERDLGIVIAGCASFCNRNDVYDYMWLEASWEAGRAVCTGTSSCCQAPVAPTLPKEIHAKWLYSGNHTTEQRYAPVNVFVAEEGWVDQNMRVVADEFEEVPLVLSWSIKLGLPQGDNYTSNVTRMLCKSENSHVWYQQPGYMCECLNGYDGNPYLAGGCQDVNECHLPSEENGCLFGTCINKIGGMECRCPHGTYGDSSAGGGCVSNSNYSTTATAADALLPMADPAQIGLPSCNTSCGEVVVPYPFGISPGCYWPGFKLICDTSEDPPRLLLDSGTMLEVVGISLPDSTLRVSYITSTSYNTSNFSAKEMSDNFQILNMSETYTLSTRNELILFGCDVQATLYGEHTNHGGNISITSDKCVSDCNSGYLRGYCSGHDGCCHVPISAVSKSNEVYMKIQNLTIYEEETSPFAFISEQGMTDQWYNILTKWTTEQSIPYDITSPLVLTWAVKQDISAPTGNSAQCPEDVASRLCKSHHSDCQQENGGFTCYCSTNYHGNPYIANGCRDMCNIMAKGNPCYGDCNNLPGGQFKCQCPRGTHGNPFQPGGCFKSPPGLIIGLSVASGPTLLLLVLVTILIVRKIKQRRIKLLKQKYFIQNRGQLLQQLMSQKADIAEKMIISVDELVKATNNFDKARELGGGGYGTVYKGILSDLHVVAIKKSKIAVQKEIDEFINEVAILSQINHKNVVKLFGCCLETEVPLLVYEFISNGTLYNHLHVEEPRSLSWGNRLRIATEIATSLAYLHSAVSIPIIHRDIKSSNILLDDTLTSKVSDFGASRHIPIEKTGLTTRVQGTIGYLDPMYFYTSRLTEKSDVYSFGVILIELLTRKKPFSYLSNEGNGLVAHFVDLLAEGNLVQIIDPQVIEEGGEEVQEVAALAASCVNIRGGKRPTMRLVVHKLEAVCGTKKYKDDTGEAECMIRTEGQQIQESSRRYSLEQETMISSRYPR